MDRIKIEIIFDDGSREVVWVKSITDIKFDNKIVKDNITRYLLSEDKRGEGRSIGRLLVSNSTREENIWIV